MAIFTQQLASLGRTLTDLAMVPSTRWNSERWKKIALESKPSFIAGSPHGNSPHGKRMLQSADGGFHPGPPAQPSPKPALLRLGPLCREPSARGQCHLLHSQGLRLPFVFWRKKCAVAARHLRRLPEARWMLREGRPPGRAIVRIARREPGNRSRCRFPPRRSAPAYQTRWVYALCLCESLRGGALTGATLCPPPGGHRPTPVSWFWVITLSTRARKYRSWPICVSTRSSVPTTCSRPFPQRCTTSLACRTTLRVRPTNFW
jgi:hypothetical protein